MIDMEHSCRNRGKFSEITGLGRTGVVLAEMDAEFDALSNGDEQTTETSSIAGIYTQISAHNRQQRSMISESTSLKIVVYRQSLERLKGRNCLVSSLEGNYQAHVST